MPGPRRQKRMISPFYAEKRNRSSSLGAPSRPVMVTGSVIFWALAMSWFGSTSGITGVLLTAASAVSPFGVGTWMTLPEASAELGSSAGSLWDWVSSIVGVKFQPTNFISVLPL